MMWGAAASSTPARRERPCLRDRRVPVHEPRAPWAARQLDAPPGAPLCVQLDGRDAAGPRCNRGARGKSARPRLTPGGMMRRHRGPPSLPASASSSLPSTSPSLSLPGTLARSRATPAAARHAASRTISSTQASQGRRRTFAERRRGRGGRAGSPLAQLRRLSMQLSTSPLGGHLQCALLSVETATPPLLSLRFPGRRRNRAPLSSSTRQTLRHAA